MLTLPSTPTTHTPLAPIPCCCAGGKVVAPHSKDCKAYDYLMAFTKPRQFIQPHPPHLRHLSSLKKHLKDITEFSDIWGPGVAGPVTVAAVEQLLTNIVKSTVDPYLLRRIPTIKANPIDCLKKTMLASLVVRGKKKAPQDANLEDICVPIIKGRLKGFKRCCFKASHKGPKNCYCIVKLGKKVVEGKAVWVREGLHRLVCRAKWGDPPPGKTQAIHTCGHKWCIAPGHLRWGSAAENAADYQASLLRQ